MKTTFAVIGVIFVILILYGGERLYWLYQDYQNATSFVEETIGAVVPGWDQEELVRRFAPKALEGVTEDELIQVFIFYRTAFGELLTRGNAEGTVHAETGGATLGVFTVSMEFSARSAVATITVQKFKGYWAVTDFRIRSMNDTQPQDREEAGEPNRTVASVGQPMDAAVG